MLELSQAKVQVYEYDLVSKSHWGYGVWQDEPDRAEWKSHDLLCLIVRHDRGYLQGFVGVSYGASLWGMSAEEARRLGIAVHRGIEYAAPDRSVPLSVVSPFAGDISAKLYHVPSEPRTGATWFLGFHCNQEPATEQPGDFAPDDTLAEARPTLQRAYRTFSYVHGEVERLAIQLANQSLQTKLAALRRSVTVDDRAEK